MNKLTVRKKAELRLIADLTLDATLVAEEKLSRLAGRAKTITSPPRRRFKNWKKLK